MVITMVIHGDLTILMSKYQTFVERANLNLWFIFKYYQTMNTSGLRLKKTYKL